MNNYLQIKPLLYLKTFEKKLIIKILSFKIIFLVIKSG